MTSNTNTPSNVSEPRQPLRKKPRLSAPSSSKSSTPNAYARRSPPRNSQPERPARSPSPRRSRSRSPSRSPPRKLKRPGAGARINASERAAAAAAVQRRHEADARAEQQQQEQDDGKGRAVDLVASHYNAVPQRGRAWRKEESEIKGLRSLNNWVKSTLIQKFGAAQDTHGAPLLVLDVACGKGGDIGKWEKALGGRGGRGGLYVGCDVADVSIQQARDRWGETLRRSRRDPSGVARPGEMEAEFYVLDAFSRSFAEIPRVRQLGFDPRAGPGGSGVIQGGMGGGGGFDVVSMMFALHYSYETEQLARGMLGNISGALKKGGRFIGVMPDSDVISGMVKKLLGGVKKKSDSKKVELKEGDEEGEIVEEGEVEEEEDDWDPEKPSEPHTNGAGAAEEEEDEWDPEKPSEPQPSTTTNGTAPHPATTAPSQQEEEEEDDWDPEKPSEAPPKTTTTPANPSTTTPSNPASTSPTTVLPPLEWGNTLHTIRFPQTQPTSLPLPADGIFRPPYGWRYHYHLAEAVDVPEYVVPWEAFRALAEEYGLELMYRKGFREVLGDETAEEGELRMLAERMGVLRRGGDGRGGVVSEVREEEMEVASFYHAFVFYKT